jgi:glycosyltransferase involved in cell wall biosynthesis
MQATQTKPFANDLDGISSYEEFGLPILCPSGSRNGRRVLFVNNYGGEPVWRKMCRGEMPSHHLWGCIELARRGYEVALAEPLPDFNPYRRQLPHDLAFFRLVQSWLRRDDIIYCGHNVLFWLPLLKSFGVLRRRVVSLLFAREPLAFSGSHDGIIALTPTAAETASRLAPRAKVAHLGWGVNYRCFPVHAYRPKYLLHCGIAGRDFRLLNQASQLTEQHIRFIAPGRTEGLIWPPHVEIFDSGHGYNHEAKKVSFSELLHEHYAGSAAALIVTIPNPEKNHALGFTNLIEALAMGQPIIHTQTGALVDEIDVEKQGCGIGIPPGDPHALAEAMDFIMNNPTLAEAMGVVSRKLCEQHYNIERYANDLHRFFESL